MVAVRPAPLPSDEIAAFLADLARQGKSPVTISGYQHDLADWGRWFAQTNDEAFSSTSVLRLWFSVI